MFSFFLLTMITIVFLQPSAAFYGPKTDVVNADEKSFSSDVLKHPGIVLVEFYAPWCGHCRNLIPEYEKAASLLKGVVKVVAVDATQAESLAGKYQVKGFPTIKLFGADKKNPVDYQGQRTADAMVSEAMKAANKLVKDRKSGGGGGSKGSSSSSSSGGSSGGGSGKKSRSDVVELTDVNFNALVLDSEEQWLVEFFAPWCGHCKQLAPEWESAATQLKGSVRLGAVDATVHTSLASKYDVKGYPTIKVFPAGKKGKDKKAKDYNGPREAAGIVQYAADLLEAAGVPPKLPQLTTSAVFEEACGVNGRICVIMFVPHILDSGASGRNGYLDTLREVAKSLRGKPFTYLWTEAGAQSALEESIGVNFYPTLAVVSTDKKVFAVQKLSWSQKNIKSFLDGVLSGSERKAPLTAVPSISKVKEWDGKDAEVVQEDIPLDELFKDD